ncbi:MAG TPA: aspartyl/asparaginyl beta-hydroxylase domain-containing protein [Phenylobacterium sp.]|jgi:aspartate beta-hydroxylase|uniref:aspartyl/asparaginyl beta-hydroxylase domain-containing protein n=1 Tax=Phenylobacterium sp. TaxID=1871053 RepID=UPI002C2A7C52|nr:aspartyl/asparaginyl beta-hydroxylase domain-containing protein [Phenylobacterium sp.]HXA37558.1 aspartyl/asparaginyl beta-hydroxylase domain-containing protein [Phenylobacterium sp.]
MPQPPNTDVAADLQAAWNEAARALREGRGAEAEGHFQAIVAAGQATPAVWVGIALARRGSGDLAGEREALEAALRLDPREMRALIMMADHHAAAGDARAADSYYLAFARLAETGGDPAWQAEAKRARAMIARFAAAYEEQLRHKLAPHALDQPQGRRMRRSLDLLLGKSEIYLQQPRHFYFPELPNIEYADREAFPWLDRVEAATGDIRAELLRVLQEDGAFSPYVEAEPNRPSFNDNGMIGNPDWSAFYLWKAGAPVAENVARCPAAMAALAEAPLCRIPGRTPSILFSLLRPGMHIAPHHGFMNARYICHLPLIVPEGCAMRVGSETRAWTEGRACVFDDSIEHEAWNRNPDQLRVVMIFDVWRPELSPAECDFVSSVLQAVDTYGADATLP